MLNDVQVLSVVLTIAAVTFLTRFLPFALFNKSDSLPAYINFLGRYLPMAIIGMLVVYCFKGATPLKYPYALPELIAGLSVVGLHLYKKNLLLSIVGSTAIYMVLIQKFG